MIKKLTLFLIIALSEFIISGCTNLQLTSKKPYSNDQWHGDEFSGFSQYKSVIGEKYMISTSEKLASMAGAEILENGGNAIDASIASQLVLNVIEPHSSGIGGGLFLLYHDKKSGKNVYFNGRENAPINSFPEMFLDIQGNPQKFFEVVGTGLAVGTPGALHALFNAHQQYGKMPWKKLFVKAINIAREGYPISPKMFANLKSIKHLSESDGMRIYFDNDGQPKKIGTIIKNYQLAKTLETIANKGIKPFYEGQIAQDIEFAVKNSKKMAGYLTKEDLKKYRSNSGKLICAKYRQTYKICSMPLPSSGGITILQTLGILENFDLSQYKPNSPEAIHLILESLKLSYSDRNKYLGDIPTVPIKQMLDKQYLKMRAQTININQANNNVRPGDFEGDFETSKKSITSSKIYYPTPEKPSTTHLSVVDQYGNAVSLTSSIEYPFGSTLIVDGFFLNNQMTDFSFLPSVDGKAVANRVEPLKQPLSSMSPTFVFDNKNRLIEVVGSPNGPRIIQHVIKALIATLDWKLDIQEAISLPNFIALNGIVELEKNTDLIYLKKPLQKIGHKVKITHITSAIQAIKIENSKLYGGADPRRQGSAIGK
ncbi:MAG: gamma-glutamyltransferase [Proteobacteria bacterium]|nr:gamma-glutamyltransferase [Pseudomonadota bacterium]NCA28576.1 gamma-glutamyltransferase [Pseudomonadota bacterium]